MLQSWNNFFTTSAQAGATLIGLLFVTVTVGTGFSTPKAIKATRAFLTPTLTHFGQVLFLSMVCIAPIHSGWSRAVLTGLIGLICLTYQLRAIGLRHAIYSEAGSKIAELKWTDWIPHSVLPIIANLGVLLTAVCFALNIAFGPGVLAISAAILLFCGIYGAWDITLFLVRNRNSHEKPE